MNDRRERAGEFQSVPQYFPDGDHLTLYFAPDLCYAKRVDDLVTVYLSDKSDELVGCKIKGVSHLAKNVASMVDITHENMQVQLLFLSIVGTGAPQEYIYELSQRSKGLSFDASEALMSAA